MWFFRKKGPSATKCISLGTGFDLDNPGEIIENLGFYEGDRKGHFWCFGTTRVGKTRTMESIVEQDTLPFQLSMETFEKAKTVAPRLDVYSLEQEWREWITKKGELPRNPDTAFIGFCKQKYKQGCSR